MVERQMSGNLGIPPNDWQIKKCLALSLSLLLATLGLIGLAVLGFDIPVLRQIIGFVFLSFVPGILLLKILRVHNAGIIESLLYSVGLSLAFIIATGVVANFALPPLGISYPISLAPLTATFTIFFFILCCLAYARDKDFRPTNRLPKDSERNVRPRFGATANPFLAAILLPLLAILGASLVNSHQNNTLLLALIFVIAILVGLVAFNKFIPPRVYPFMIVMMALALIYQTTFISSYLVGSDIHWEHYYANLVIENGRWDATGIGLVNSCLSIVVLAPVYSLLLNMDIVWLFKIIYPLLFSLLPLALFRIFRLQIKPHYAFLAAFFFISMPMFTMDMAQLCRQQVSELFFVLVILLMVDRKLTVMQRTTLVLIFGFGVVVSHYGMGTGYIGYLLFGALVLIIIKSRLGRSIWQWLIGKRNALPDDLSSAGAFNKRALVTIVGISLVFMLGYYSVVASGSALAGTRVATNIAQDTTEQIIHTTTPPAETPPGTPLRAPILISPANALNVANPTPKLEWNASTGASSYGLQISSDRQFAQLVIDETGITDTYYSVTSGLNWTSKYYWRVNASHDSSTSKWSQWWYFKTRADETAPALELPGFIQNITARFPMLNPLVKERLTQTALGLDFPAASPGGRVWRILQYLVELCLIVGFFRLIFRPGTLGKLKAEYLSLTIVSILILLSVFIFPGPSYHMGATRIFQITLLLMSPLFLFGSQTIVYGIARLANKFRKGFASSRLSLDNPAFLRFPALAILIPYFIFNSGVAFELSRSQTTHFIDMPYSIALSSYRVDVSTVYTRQDIAAARWLSNVGKDSYCIYTDGHSRLAFPVGEGPLVPRAERRLRFGGLRSGTEDMSFPSYIYFRAFNTEKKMLTFATAYAARQSIDFDDIPGLTQLVESTNRIYNNGGAQVLAPSGTEE